MHPADFLADENWHGGYYELAIDLGASEEAGSDQRLAAAMSSIWADDRLDGCYPSRWKRPEDQERVSPFVRPMEEPVPLYGLVKLPEGQRGVCVVHVVREISTDEQPAHDWIDLCLPLGSLSRADARVAAYPFDEERPSLEWRQPIDEWLALVAVRVYGVARFRSASVGFELSGMPVDLNAAEIAYTVVVPDHDGVPVIRLAT